MISKCTTLPFPLPPRLYTPEHALRRVGVEFEYAGVSIPEASRIIQQIFGGEIESESTYISRVKNTPFGTFTVEIDTSILKEKRYENWLAPLGISAETLRGPSLENSLISLFSTLVPFEVSTPPIPLPELHKMDLVREELRKAGAKGTQASVLYAFGLHFNPELPENSVASLARYLRAFLQLFPWIKKEVNIDFTRRMSPFVQPFSEEYTALVLSPGYPESDEQFVHDYMKYNPTRNRVLDLLPPLLLLREDLVAPHLLEPTLVKPRAAFHYRMPNCLIDDPNWTIQKEWATWLEVERLANEAHRSIEKVDELRGAA